MSRMFGIHPALICNKHTGSEWAEISQEAGTVNAGRIRTALGHLQKFQFNIDLMKKRRTQLENERQSRGLKAENYTKIKRNLKGYGHLIDSLTIQIMEEKAENIEKCDCLNREKTRKRLEKRWQNI